MTARELRNHLRDAHGVVTRGLAWDELQGLHGEQHDVPVPGGHEHEDDEP